MKKLSCCLFIVLLILSSRYVILAEEAFKIGDEIICDVEILNVRLMASATSDKVGRVSQTQKGQVLSDAIYNEGYTWYKIDFGEIKGWVAGEYLKLSSRQETRIAFVNVESVLMLREEPSVQSRVLDKLKKGTKLEIIGETINSGSYEWIQVRIGDMSGYVAQKYLVFSESSIGGGLGSVSEDSSVRKLIDVKINRDENYLPTFDFISSKPLEYDKYFLDSGANGEGRIVLDLKNSSVEKVIEKNINIYPVKSIRVAPLNQNTIRVIIDLEKKKEYYINELDGQYGIQLHFEKDDYYLGDSRDTISSDSKKNDNRDGSTNYFSGLKKITEDGYTLKFETEKKPDYRVIRLDDPKRYVIDIMNTRLSEPNLKIDDKNSYLTRIRTSQFNPDSNYKNIGEIVRVVFDLKEDTLIETKIEDESLVVRFANDMNENRESNILKYEKFYDKSKIMISRDDLKNDKIIFDDEKNYLKIELDDLEEESQIPINDDRISKIRYDLSGEKAVAYVDLYNNIDYSARWNGEIYEITFEKQRPAVGQKTIVIDAGHGGDHRKLYKGHIGDSGAISPYSKVMEKDLTLSVSLKLKDVLKSRGYNIIMTRDKDEYIYLYDRAEIANQTDANAFISIHFNSSKSPNSSGVLTMYCPSYESELKSSDQYPLAKAMQETLSSELNMKSIGIWKKPQYVVLRETKMPSVLLELGFLTNRSDEKLARSEDYQTRAANAIANALDKYFAEGNN